MVRTNFPWVLTIPNLENLGFARANNIALPYCQGTYVFFLNPDTVIFDDTMQEAASYMERRQNVGLARAHLLNPDGTHRASVEKDFPRQRFDK
jgi:GT2 family glycosyltransferase